VLLADAEPIFAKVEAPMRQLFGKELRLLFGEEPFPPNAAEEVLTEFTAVCEKTIAAGNAWLASHPTTPPLPTSEERVSIGFEISLEQTKRLLHEIERLGYVAHDSALNQLYDILQEGVRRAGIQQGQESTGTRPASYRGKSGV
jgi:hypothetical protein